LRFSFQPEFALLARYSGPMQRSYAGPMQPGV
jgi:hypothetical protein